MSTDPHKMSRNQILEAAARTPYSKEDADILLWLHGYWIDYLFGDAHQLAEVTGYDWTVITRVWTGKYPGGVDKFCSQIRALKHRITSTGIDRFVDTQVTKRIVQHMDSLSQRPGIGLIVGPTGRSKTHTLTHWARANNHGRAIMVEAPPYGGTKACLEALARKLNLGKNRTTSQLQQLITSSITASNIVIIDEAIRLLSPRTVQTLEVLRSLHDQQGASLVFCLTRIGKNEIEQGPQAAYLEQLVGRISWVVEIPEKVTYSEAKSVVASYLLDGTAPPTDLIKAVRDLANAATGHGMAEMGRLRIAFRMLDHAKSLAESKQQPLALIHLQAAMGLRKANRNWED